MLHRCASILFALLVLNACKEAPNEEAAPEKSAAPATEPAIPSDRAPVEPEPAPVDPAPLDPAPLEPAPLEPAPEPTAPQVSLEQFFEGALSGDAALIRAGLAGGIKAGQAGPDGRTALMLASFNGHTEIARFLLDAGAPIDARDQIQRTALMYGCTAPNLELVGLLIEKKADVNLKDGEQSWTPLMFAASEGQAGVAALLLKAGADPHARDVDGEDAALFAQSKGHTEVATMIEAAKAAAK